MLSIVIFKSMPAVELLTLVLLSSEFSRNLLRRCCSLSASRYSGEQYPSNRVDILLQSRLLSDILLEILSNVLNSVIQSARRGV